jgi:hypothetical protein
MVDVRMIPASMVDAVIVDIRNSLAAILDVVNCKVDMEIPYMVEAMMVDVCKELVVILETYTSSEGTNWPFVDVVNSKFIETGWSSSCKIYV